MTVRDAGLPLTGISMMAVVLVSACASGNRGLRQQLLLSSRPAPKGQDCWIADEDPPPLATIVDSLGLHGDIREYANTANLKPGHALLSIATSLGGNRSRPPSVIETTFPDTTAAVLSDLVSQRIQSDSVQGSTRVRLQITIDSVPRFEVGRSEFCRPALANRQELTRILAGANQQAERYGTVRLELFVTGSGRVSEVKIDATSGDDMIDGLAIGVARAMRFKPASIDYVPTAVWIQMPVVFRGR